MMGNTRGGIPNVDLWPLHTHKHTCTHMVATPTTHVPILTKKLSSEPLFFKLHVRFILYVCMCACVHMFMGTHTRMHTPEAQHACENQKTTSVITCLLPPCNSQGSKSGHQAWRQVPLYMGPSMGPKSPPFIDWTSRLIRKGVT